MTAAPRRFTMFHAGKRYGRKTYWHEREIILEELTRRGWRLRELARRMEGDTLRNRALLSIYLRHSTGHIELGHMMAGRLDQAFGFADGRFEKLAGRAEAAPAQSSISKVA